MTTVPVVRESETKTVAHESTPAPVVHDLDTKTEGPRLCNVGLQTDEPEMWNQVQPTSAHRSTQTENQVRNRLLNRVQTIYPI